MQKNTYPGKFIVFEGLDGSGQTTQVNLLRDFLTGEGYKVFLTKEPTQNSTVGQKIRDVLDKKIKIDSKSLQELFTQDRKEHLEKEIVPALSEGKTVICDRYFFSTFAFGAASSLDLEWLIEINNAFLLPDLTFLLQVSPDVCVRRIEKRGEGVKFFEKKEKLSRAWEIYKTLPSRFKSVYMIYGEKTKEEVFSQVKEVVLSKLINNKKGG
jgi:dTMP kinase